MSRSKYVKRRIKRKHNIIRKYLVNINGSIPRMLELRYDPARFGNAMCCPVTYCKKR